MKPVFTAFFLTLMSPLPALAQSQAAPETASESPQAISERSLGELSALVRIDVYLSFVCVECATWWQTVLPEVKGRYIQSGQARLVFHDVAIEPIQHSVRASMIGLCAEPERFFDVADAFMGGLASARADTSAVDAWYESATAASGRTAEEMTACQAREAIYEQVRSQNAAAQAAGVANLPAVAVNGRVLMDASIQSIASAMLFQPAQ